MAATQWSILPNYLLSSSILHVFIYHGLMTASGSTTNFTCLNLRSIHYEVCWLHMTHYNATVSPATLMSWFQSYTMEQLLVELTNVTCVNFIWRAAVDVAYSVLTLMAGVKGQNGFVSFVPSRMRLNVNRSGSTFSSTNVLVYIQCSRWLYCCWVAEQLIIILYFTLL